MKLSLDLTPWSRGPGSEAGRLALGCARALSEERDRNEALDLKFVSRALGGLRGQSDDVAGENASVLGKKIEKWNAWRRLTNLGPRIYHGFTSELAPGRGDKVILSLSPVESAMLESDAQPGMSSWAHARRRRQVLAALRRADRVVVPTEWQRTRLISHDRDLLLRTHVVPPAPLLRPGTLGPSARFAGSATGRDVAEMLADERPFVLVVGDTEARSNLGLVADALTRVAGMDVLLLGRSRPGGEVYERALSELLQTRRVTRAPRLDDATLSRVIERARAVVISSPGLVTTFLILEALARGRPLLLSRNPDHDELAGAAPLYFDAALGARELSDFFESVRDDAYVQRELAERSLQRARAFSWSQSLKQLMFVYENAVR